MAYIGSSNVEALNTQLRPRDEFAGTGYQKEYVLAQEIPGGFESNVLAIVDNVPQEPVTAYTIQDVYRIIISGGVIKQIRNVTIGKPTGSTATGVANYASNSVLYNSVKDMLNGVNAFTSASGDTITLQQRTITGNTLVAEITVNKVDSANQPTAIVGVLSSGAFVTDTTSHYLLFRNTTDNVYYAFNPTGLVDVGNTLPNSSFYQYFTATSVTAEAESPKISDKITQGSATGIIANATTSFIDVVKTSTANFSAGATTVVYNEPKTVNYDTDTITYENETSGSFLISSIELLRFRAIVFSGVPELGQNIYITHTGGSNYQVTPSAGSVTDLALADNLKSFTVDKFVSTLSQQDFTMSKVPVSPQAILVTVNGVVQTDTVDYTIVGGTTCRLASPLVAGIKVNILHLGFGTVSRNSYVDGAIATAALRDQAVTAAKIADSTITNSKLAAGVAIANLGYTPHNPTSLTQQTYAGALAITGNLTTNGYIQFPGTQNASTNPNVLDDYEEGDFSPTLIPATGTGIAYSFNQAKYIKIGRLVKVSGKIVVNDLGTASGTFTIGGMPTIANGAGNVVFDYGTLVVTNGTSFTSPLVRAITNTTTLGVLTNGSVATIANLTASSVLEFSISYISND